MFIFKKPALIAVAMLSFTAHAQTQDDLQELLKANPVTQSDLASLDSEISGGDHSNLSKVSGTSTASKSITSVAEEKKIAVENEIAKTLSSEKVALKSVSGGNLFVSNIPTGSTFKFGNKLMLTTNGTAMFFQNGERVYSNPFIKDKFSTFCMFRFTPATTGRRITPSNLFSISGVGYKTLDKKMGLSADKHIQILKLNVNNKDFKQVVCYSGSMDRPLTTGDLSKIIGNGMKMKIEQYRDI